MSDTRRKGSVDYVARGLAIAQRFAKGSIQVVTPEMFGAAGDGITDDTKAFQQLSAYINLRRGGTVVLASQAVYRAGFQYVSGVFAGFGGNILDFKDCNAVSIQGNGATIKFLDGMKYGTFDPATGLPKNTKAPYYNNGEDRYDLGTGLYAWNIGKLYIENLTFDMNVSKLRIGGEWGDVGRQCTAYGHFVRDCSSVLMVAVDAFNSPQDGGACAQYLQTATSPTHPHTYINCRIDTQARNGFSVLGTNSFHAIDCSFDNSGLVNNDAFGPFGTAPGSGVDVEAEGSTCHNVRFTNCRFGAATGNTFVADTGDTRDITFDHCEFNGIFWTSKPYTRLYNCTINGVVRRAYGGQRGVTGGTLFTDCIFNANRLNDLVVDTQGSGALEFIRCQFNIVHGTFNMRGAWVTDCNMVVSVNTDELVNNGLLGYMEGAVTSNFNVSSSIDPTKSPANGYYIPVALNTTFLTGNAIAGGKIYWGLSSPAFQGEIWLRTVTVASAITNTSSVVTATGINLPFALARQGDRIEARFIGPSTAAVFTATVASDDVVNIGVILPNGGASIGPGTFSLRLYKNGN